MYRTRTRISLFSIATMTMLAVVSAFSGPLQLVSYATSVIATTGRALYRLATDWLTVTVRSLVASAVTRLGATLNQLRGQAEADAAADLSTAHQYRTRRMQREGYGFALNGGGSAC